MPSSPSTPRPTGRIRREPPPFRPVAVAATRAVTPRLVRVTLAGPALAGFVIDEPAASIRLLLPVPADGPLVMPAWNGNEFLLPDGRRPAIRTFTPRGLHGDGTALDLDLVIHGDGVAARWAQQARPGDPAAVAGPGRGYTIDPSAHRFVIAGDETAIPAISQLLEVLPTSVTIDVHVEVARPEARVELPAHPGATATWHDATADAPPGDTLVSALRHCDLDPTTRVWVAGEAAAMQRIRRHLLTERDVPRDHAVVRGYWKQGRAGADATG